MGASTQGPDVRPSDGEVVHPSFDEEASLEDEASVPDGPALDNGRALEDAAALDDRAGDPACWAGLLCPECGVVLDGSPHQEDCSVPSLVT
jgi:hypothetical protein